MAVIAAALAIGLISSPQRTARADDAVAGAIVSLMKQIEPVLESNRFSVISVGGFTSIAGTSAGPELQMKFAAVIEQSKKFRLDPVDYDAMIRGRIERVELNAGMAVRIVAQLFDANNRPIGQFSGSSNEVKVELSGQEAIPRLLGITTNTGGVEDATARDRIFQKHLEADPCAIDGTIVKADGQCPYGVQLLVKRGDKYVPVTPSKRGRRGNAFAPIDQGEVFAIGLYNYSPVEAAVNLTIDGISTFAFSEVRQGTVYWIVPPAKDGKPGTALIRGWDIDDERSYEFKQVGYPESAAKKLHIEPNEALGQVCAQFSKALPYTGGARSAGLGEVIQDKKRQIQRDIGPLEATIVVRYERNPLDPNSK